MPAVEEVLFHGLFQGGRQALLAAQRFPLAFDAVMSVAPAARVGTATISSVWDTIALSEIAPKDADGRPILSKTFSNGDLTLVANSVARVCDAQDGVRDGLIFNTRNADSIPRSWSAKGVRLTHVFRRNKSRS